MTADLAAWVREDFGVELASLDRARLGADTLAELWHGVSVAGQRFAVKLSAGGSAAGLTVPALLAARGIDGVLAPLSTRDGRMWTIRGERRLSVAPWVSDRRGMDEGLTPAHWRHLGALLAEVHATEVTGELAALPRESYDHGRLADTVHALDFRRDDVDAVLAIADRLANMLRDKENSVVVCHADPHTGNVLLDGEKVWLIDWDDAVLAPREQDLMFVLGGVLAFAPVTPGEQQAFFEGYGPVKVDQDHLRYHRCVRALVDLTEWALDGSEQALGHVRDVLSPTGLIAQSLHGHDLAAERHQ
ncbi:spectinomycin phosphotransferase [Herbihabitans rhizosphaerae]|uniref:Spectinomycin phosphotransferase n=1 Tax=Herbihabitans rhizosphaerae TaxID=1872711 RepID=A0A4Q7KW84_9PSEU|nr:phosphotransferase [Herbihabitans rhizosphaerae]RZS41014.1 spectinomycin phosphotransferase [Herbihabitans rhizosphaerae]